MREADIERKFVDGVRKLGGKAYKFVSPGNTGVPDRLVILPGGCVWFIELKTDKGRLSDAQKAQLRQLGRLGCNTAVLYGMDGVKGFLDSLKDTGYGV